VAFVSGSFNGKSLNTRRRQVSVRGCRGIGLRDMMRNTTVGDTVVDVAGGQVTFDGELIEAEPAATVSLNRLYFL
ncbi:MAG: urease subunit alpha, partial [Candidatus Nanopelagicales bacterium]